MLLALEPSAAAPGPKNLPSPAKTWEASKLYVLEPFAKRGELDQGILRFTWYSLVLVAKGYALALLIGTPLGFLLGLSKLFTEELRSRSSRSCGRSRRWPGCRWGWCCSRTRHPAALFTIAICAMWPTVLNTAVGVRAIPQDYLNVARVLKLSPTKTLFKILLPATLPYMFTGFRLSLGIAWLVIVAAEMLTGAPGVGGFLWQEYNSLIYEHIILCILTIGLVGFVLDRLMSVVERRFQTRVSAWPFLELRGVGEGLRHRARARVGGAARHQPRGRAGRVRGHRRLLRRGQDDAHLADRRA